MKNIIVKGKDPFPELKKMCNKIIIESSSSGVKYKPDGLPFSVQYLPGSTNIAQSDLRYFSIVKKEATEWMEKRVGYYDKPQKLPIIRKNDSLINDYPVFYGAYYADVVGAYWNTARKMGVITEKTFQAVYKKKYLRNMLLGSLAKKIDIFEWKKGRGSELIQARVKQDTDDIFFLIADYVSMRMQVAMTDSFFMWVDCIYSPFPDTWKMLDAAFEKKYDFTKKKKVVFSFNFSENKAVTLFDGETETKDYFFKRHFEFMDTV